MSSIKQIIDPNFWGKEVVSVSQALQKKFGKSYINIASEVLDTDYKRNTTGVYSLDYLCGGGGIGWGIPERKILMLGGKESSGKTATALLTIAAYQRNNKKCALLNVEHGFDAIWATRLGVDLTSLLMAFPQTIEQASDTMEPLIMTESLDLIVLDSIASLSSDKELEESSETQGRSGNAKANGQMARKITARLNDPTNSKLKTSILLINQIREKQNVMYGSPEYLPGGHPLHHACDIIIWLRPDSASKAIGDKEKPIGIGVNAICTKNRTSPPLRKSSYNIMFDGYLDERENLIEIGITKGIIQKNGYKYTYINKDGSSTSVTDMNPFMEALSDQQWIEIKKQLLTTKKEEAPSIVEQPLEVDKLNVKVETN